VTFEEAATVCHVRSAIYRETKPEVRYWYNHPVPLHERVPAVDQLAHDWDEYDPREGPLVPFEKH
jgi:hypothetical protein